MNRRILYVQYTNPGNYPPLQHSSRLLAERGWQVRFVGIKHQGVDLTMRPHARIELDRMNAAPRGPLQKLHFAAYNARVARALLQWRPDWVYASDLWSCPAGLLAARLGCRVIYHEHDEPVRTGASVFVRSCLRARSWLATRAATCVLPNEARRTRFVHEHSGARTAVVWNCPAREEVQSARSGPGGRSFILHYHGSLGATLLPETLLHALKLLPGEVRLRVFGYETIGSRGYREQLRLRARNLGVEPRLELHPAVPRAELWAEMQQAAVGISLTPTNSGNPNLEALAGASNKTFDYLAAGLALLITKREDWLAPFGAFGEACDPQDAVSVAAAIRRLYQDRMRTLTCGAAGRQRVLDEWNYEQQFQPVSALLDG